MSAIATIVVYIHRAHVKIFKQTHIGVGIVVILLFAMAGSFS